VAEPLLRIATPQDEPLVLAGPPARLTGQIDLHNPSDVSVVLRDAGFNDPSGVLRARPGRHSFSPLVVRAHQQQRGPVTISVDPGTPPGEYRAEIELAGGTRPVVLHVTESIDLTVHPQSIVVLNQRGTQRRRVVVTNEGNVPFAVGDLGDVDLESDMLSDRTRLGLEPVTRAAQIDGRDVDGPVFVLLRLAPADAFRESGLSVRSHGPAVTITPGETVVIDLDITLQADLPPNSRYRGRTPLLTRDLEFVVVSSAPAQDDVAADKPAKKATKGQGGRREGIEKPHAR
jgi:hypothetical protein